MKSKLIDNSIRGLFLLFVFLMTKFSYAQVNIEIPLSHFLNKYMAIQTDAGHLDSELSFDLPYEFDTGLPFFPYKNRLQYFNQNKLGYSVFISGAYDMDSEKMYHYSSLWAWDKITDNLLLFLAADLTSHPNGEYLLGTRHTRFSNTGTFSSAYIKGKWPAFEFLIGRGQVHWGAGRINNLGIRGDFPSIDQIRVTFKKNSIYRLTYFLGQLEKKEVTIEEGFNPIINRWLAGHRLELYLFNKKITLGLGDYVLYTGENRGIELNYFNPLSPFHLQTFENKVEGYQTQLDSIQADNQNIAIYSDINVQYKDGHHLYGEIYMDEFQMDEADRKKLDDVVGLLVGFSGVIKHSSSLFHYAVEGYRLPSWLYNHGGIETDWVYNGHCMGFERGGDLIGINASSDYWFNPKFMMGLSFHHYDQGEITPTTEWNPFATKGKGLPFGTVESEQSIGVKYFYFAKPWLLLEGEVQYVTYENFEHKINNSESQFQGFFKVQIII